MNTEELTTVRQERWFIIRPEIADGYHEYAFGYGSIGIGCGATNDGRWWVAMRPTKEPQPIGSMADNYDKIDTNKLGVVLTFPTEAQATAVYNALSAPKGEHHE